MQVSPEELAAARVRVEERDRLAFMDAARPSERHRREQRERLAREGALYWKRRQHAVDAAAERRAVVVASRAPNTTPKSASDAQLERVERALTSLVVHLDVGFAEQMELIEQLDGNNSSANRAKESQVGDKQPGDDKAMEQAVHGPGREVMDSKDIHHERLDQFEAILHVHLAALCASQKHAAAMLARLVEGQAPAF